MTEDVAEDRSTANEARARFFRALGDPTRLAIVQYLLEGPHTVGELVEKLGVPQSRVSNHLACLRWCLFVEAERQGRQVVYSISDARLARLLTVASSMVTINEEQLASRQRIGPDWI
jgi:DNA-binding transcriptional ArsR family regulator